MNVKSKEIQLLYIQFYDSIIFIIAIIVSLILNYNNILKVRKNKSLFNDSLENKITFYNRVLLTIITIIFTYVNYEFYVISKQKNKGTLQKEEFIASILSLIAGFILLYTTIKNINNKTHNTNTDTPLI